MMCHVLTFTTASGIQASESAAARRRRCSTSASTTSRGTGKHPCMYICSITRSHHPEYISFRPLPTDPAFKPSVTMCLSLQVGTTVAAGHVAHALDLPVPVQVVAGLPLALLQGDHRHYHHRHAREGPSLYSQHDHPHRDRPPSRVEWHRIPTRLTTRLNVSLNCSRRACCRCSSPICSGSTTRCAFIHVWCHHRPLLNLPLMIGYEWPGAFQVRRAYLPPSKPLPSESFNDKRVRLANRSRSRYSYLQHLQVSPRFASAR